MEKRIRGRAMAGGGGGKLASRCNKKARDFMHPFSINLHFLVLFVVSFSAHVQNATDNQITRRKGHWTFLRAFLCSCIVDETQ